MPINHRVVGRARHVTRRSWTSPDAILYALGVGAGADDPAREMEFTTENSAGVAQLVLPTFATLLVPNRIPDELGDFDRAAIVHGEEAIHLHAPIPAEGDALVQSRVSGVYDKASAALVVVEADIREERSGRPLATVRSGLFVRGAGGFGGPPVPKVPWTRPERSPDWQIGSVTPPEQALRYRLHGDRNPLHSDPAFARRGGFARPILHGLCTYGFAGRALLHTFAEGDPSRLATLSARFSSPVLPGDELVVRIWRDGERTALFETAKTDGTVVIDRGRATLHEEAQCPIEPQ